MIYMNTFEDLADKVRNAANSSDAARIIEDFVTEYGCSIAEKNEFNIANVSQSYFACDVCGCHPSVIIRTAFGTFCELHAKYVG